VLGLADALSAVVENLHESEAGIGRELAGGESVETVHSDGVGVVFFEQLEGGKIDGSGPVDCFGFGAGDELGGLAPSGGPFFGLVHINFVIEAAKFVEVKILGSGAEEVALLAGFAAATDYQKRRLAKTLDAFADIGQGQRVVGTIGLSARWESTAIYLLAAASKNGRGDVLAANVGELMRNKNQIAQAGRGYGRGGNAFGAQCAVSGKESSAAAEELVRYEHRFAEAADVDNRGGQDPIVRHRVDEVAVDLRLECKSLLYIVGLLDRNGDEVDVGTALPQGGQDLSLAAVGIEVGIRPDFPYCRVRKENRCDADLRSVIIGSSGQRAQPAECHRGGPLQKTPAVNVTTATITTTMSLTLTHLSFSFLRPYPHQLRTHSGAETKHQGSPIFSALIILLNSSPREIILYYLMGQTPA